ncbi:MAG: hypothetical protein ACXVDT_16185, partial [Bacteroidia bacterium]
NVIDDQLYSNYKLWPVNYIASDISNDSDEFSLKYSQAEKNNFIKYIRQKISKLKGDEQTLYNLFIAMYSNPVKVQSMNVHSLKV